ncbi:MAG: C1 family peptidase [Peptoniphilaceae bacterium]|nr:C1 family peptidase [Peptoniphilaceae bacterium]
MKNITQEHLNQQRDAFLSDRANRIAMNAVTQDGIDNAIHAANTAKDHQFQFTIDLKQGKRTNQKQSGRCWMFASLNVMRYNVIHSLNLEDFEFSESYPLFFDKYERANFFFESILKTTNEPLNSRLIAYLLQEPMGDGGQWDMFVNLVKKYGLVPKEAMPETFQSSNTRDMNEYLTKLLRQGARKLRTGAKSGAGEDELQNLKDQLMEEIYRVLTISLGVPPTSFEFAVRDKDGKYIHETSITPQEFFRKYVGYDVDHTFSLINAPTEDKPFGKTFTVAYLGNVVEGRPVHYLNLTIESLKQAAIAQLKESQPVWFGSDVGKFSHRKEGYLSADTVAAEDLFQVSFDMTKEQLLDYGDSQMTHAMVITGVQLDENENPVRWKVENSWGNEVGNDGYFVMSDDWFTRFVYQIVVNEKFLTNEEREQLKQEPIVLQPWDPMGSLAR